MALVKKLPIDGLSRAYRGLKPRAKVRAGNRTGVVIGASVMIETLWWTPVVWDCVTYPAWHTSHELEVIR